MIGMERSTGPDCPLCGCNDTTLVDAGRRSRYCWSRFQCENDGCGHVFTIGNRAIAPPLPATCTHCGSSNTYATSTPGRKQYRKCRDCLRSFSEAK